MSSSDGECPDTTLAFYHYCPNKAAAAAALAIYAALAVVNTGLNIKTRAWFMFFCAATAAFEAAGYVARLLMINSPSYGTYVVTTLFLVITPTLLAVVAYIVVGRIIMTSNAEKVAGIKPRNIAKLFGASDVVTLFIQGAAGGLLGTKGNETINKLGEWVMLVGLSAQLVFFAVFTGITISVHVRAKQLGLAGRPGLRRLFIALYGSIFLLAVRNTFRVIEFAQGFAGYLASNEPYFYAFDMALVSGAVLLLTVLHPGVLLNKLYASAPTAPLKSGSLGSNGNRVVDEEMGGAAHRSLSPTTSSGTAGVGSPGRPQGEKESRRTDAGPEDTAYTLSSTPQ